MKAGHFRSCFFASVMAITCGFVAIGIASSGLQAEPLPQDKCATLVTERDLLEGGGTAANLEKGADWGRANLTAEQLNYVRRLLAVREALLFRCRSFDVVRAPPPPSVAPESAPLPGRKPDLPKPKKSARGESVPARPQEKRAEQPRPRDDAYRPPGSAGPGLRGTVPEPPIRKTEVPVMPARKPKPPAEP